MLNFAPSVMLCFTLALTTARPCASSVVCKTPNHCGILGTDYIYQSCKHVALQTFSSALLSPDQSSPICHPSSTYSLLQHPVLLSSDTALINFKLITDCRPSCFCKSIHLRDTLTHRHTYTFISILPIWLRKPDVHHPGWMEEFAGFSCDTDRATCAQIQESTYLQKKRNCLLCISLVQLCVKSKMCE